LPFSCSCLVSSSPSKMRQFSFECCPLSQRSVLRLTTCPALGGWPVTPPLPSAFVFFLISAGCWQLLWEVDLSPHSCSQPLCHSWSLLGAGSSSGKLACYSDPTLILCCFTHVLVHWEFCTESWLLAPLLFSGQVQHSTSTSTVSVKLQFTVYVFQFCWGLGVQPAQEMHWIILQGGG
jgi:hypothetical protein